MTITGVLKDLDVDYASDTLLVQAGATDRVLQLKSVLDFADPDDGVGSVFFGDPETGVGTIRQYVAVDDEADTITLAADPGEVLAAGTSVYAWDPTTSQGSVVVEYVAVVDLDEAKPVHGVIVPHHLVAFSDVDLLRGASVEIEENDDGEWEIARVLGRKPTLDARFSNMKAEANDAYTLTTTDTGRGYATIPLSHVPVDESVKLTFGGVPQEPTEYTVDYDAATITFPLDGWEPAGLRFSTHYWYVRGPVEVPPEPLVLRPVTVGVSNTTYKSAALVGGDLALSDESDATYAEQWLSKRAGAADGPTMRINFDAAPTFVPAADCLRFRFQIMNEAGAASTDMLVLMYVSNSEIGYLERAADTGTILTIPAVNTVYDWTEWVFVQTGSMTLQEGFATGLQIRLRRNDTIDEPDGDFGVRVFDVWASGGE